MAQAPALLHIVILAAERGEGMHNRLPRALQPVGGRPMLAHVLDTARALNPAGLHVVCGPDREAVQAAFKQVDDINWVFQSEPLGIGHATQMAQPGIPAASRVLVLFGDAPLIRADSLRRLLAGSAGGISALTVEPADPTSLGCIVRNDAGAIDRIVAQEDATDSEKLIKEVNTGILVADTPTLREYLSTLNADNARGENDLTGLIAMASAHGKPATAVKANDPDEIMRANDRWQLAELERAYQKRCAKALCDEGAMLLDPKRVDVRGAVSVSSDVVIDVNVVFEGRVHLAEGVHIGPHCVIKDCELGPGTHVLSHSSLEGVITEGKSSVGPFARLRPGTRLGVNTKVGNFVETKNAALGLGTKASHLAYVGDAVVGNDVNISAGAITCNYDGANKHQTIIEDGAFIGSDTQLVAPVRVGAGATVGAGTTVTKDVPPNQLTISRVRQTAIEGWVRPAKNKPSRSD